MVAMERLPGSLKISCQYQEKEKSQSSPVKLSIDADLKSLAFPYSWLKMHFSYF
jgi:hypothetical protein